MLEKTLGHIIRDARLDSDLSLRSLAKLLEKTPSYLSDIENDHRVPSEEVLKDIASHLSLDFEHLMGLAGRIGEETNQFLKRRPAAGTLFRRIARANLDEHAIDEIHEFLQRQARRKEFKS